MIDSSSALFALAATEDLERRRQDLAEMLDAAHDAIFVSDLEGRITFWNRGAAALYGHARQEALGERPDALLNTRYPDEIEAIRKQLIETGHWEGELVRDTAHGQSVIVDGRWTLRRDADGAPIEVLETGRDVTASRKAALELKYSEYRYSNVFRAMAVSFWELDFNGLGDLLAALQKQGVTDIRAHVAAHPEIVRRMIESSIVVDVNDKSVQLFGAPREALLGSVSRFWPRSSEGVFAESVFAALERRHSYEAEARFCKADGSEFDALFTTCYPRDGVKRGTVLVGIVDISDRIAAQDALRRAEADLAHAARVSTLGELTASIAHEVNQPLAAIVTNGEAGLRWIDRPAPDLEEARAAMQRMIAEGQRASEIIARIRALASNKDPQRDLIALNAAIEDATLLLKRELMSHDVRMILALSPDTGAVNGDRIQLQQVVINLALNAIQAMAGRPSRDLTIATRRRGEEVVLDVVDTGPGVPPENAKALFNAFYSTKPAGMGMGLSICKSIVEGHGGSIAAEGAPGGGARFRVILPSAR
ncbi:PAS domain-containing sensor histidine kinase [Caulobacter segnis]|uniref:histidine kinase n=2 Tax=Caulobacter segnis TaxID=88688 RepID=D5VGU7_CAUST|nr:ATP-binding protein [Caulobacter segnis]ADG10540.1 PAS/PAC sensor signal transduction histidine kinase [Caulobacter segnis ATCC 21756]